MPWIYSFVYDYCIPTLKTAVSVVTGNYVDDLTNSYVDESGNMYID